MAMFTKENMLKGNVRDMEFILFLMEKNMKANGFRTSNTAGEHIIL